MRQRRYWLGSAGLLVLLAPFGRAAEAPSWRIQRGDVSIVVPLKPGGAFTATASTLGGTLTLDPSKPVLLTGDISIDLATIDTGISLRNQHLREKYLEVGKGEGFDRAVLSEIRLKGADGAAFEGRTAFTGILLLHGVKGPVEGTADVRHSGSDRRVRAEFRLTLADFGIAPPEYLGVGVANKLLVTAQFTARAARESAK